MGSSQSFRFGLVGHPVEHSLSPPMHRAALEFAGADGDYQLIDLAQDNLASGIAELCSKGFSGFNVTIPHKQAILSLCDQLTADADRTRAVNTVKIEDGSQLIGHNTDLGGFARALSETLPANLKTKAACVVGCGGAARAALWALISAGWPRIFIVARNPDSAAEMIDQVTALPAVGSSPLLPRFETADTTASGLSTIPDLLVNCTSIGLDGEPVPEWFVDLLRVVNPDGVVFDMVYSRDAAPTPIVREARRFRLIACDGTDMLVHQAALAFEFWTGLVVPPSVMKQALERARTT